MDLSKYKQQHVDILGTIAALRKLAHGGVARNAAEIAQRLVAMSATIKLHLAAEDQSLYPGLQRSGNAELAHMGQQYQQEMGDIAQVYTAFVQRWSLPARLRQDEQGFRDDANQVLKTLFERIQRENRHFYPRIEAG